MEELLHNVKRGCVNNESTDENNRELQQTIHAHWNVTHPGTPIDTLAQVQKCRLVIL